MANTLAEATENARGWDGVRDEAQEDENHAWSDLVAVMGRASTEPDHPLQRFLTQRRKRLGLFHKAKEAWQGATQAPVGEREALIAKAVALEAPFRTALLVECGMMRETRNVLGRNKNALGRAFRKFSMVWQERFEVQAATIAAWEAVKELKKKEQAG